MENTKQQEYKLSALSILEIIGSIIIFISLFLPWIVIRGADNYYDCIKISDSTGHVILVGIICGINIILKFFKRSLWSSLLVTTFGIGLVIWSRGELLDATKQSISFLSLNVNMGGGFIVDLLASTLMLVCLITGWFIYLSDKSKCMPRDLYKKKLKLSGLYILVVVAIPFILVFVMAKVIDNAAIGAIFSLIFTISLFVGIYMFIYNLVLGLLIRYSSKEDESVSESIAIEDNNIADAQPEIEDTHMGTLATSEPAEEQSETMEVIELDSGNSRKKWYYIGGAVAAAVIAMSCFFAFSGGSGNDNNPLGVQKPKWEKFVKVNTSDVKLYKEASTDSPVLQEAIENIDSDMAGNILMWQSDKKPRGYNVDDYCVMENTIYPVIDENDEWYRVHIGNREITEAYIQKIHCEEVKPEPITKKIIDKVKTDNWTTHKLVEKGEFANLYLERYFNEMGGGETVITGVLIDGCIVVPDECSFRPCKKDTIGTDIYNSVNSSDYNDWWMNCPKEYWKASPEVGDGIFDANKLTDSDIQKIVLAMRPQGNTASKVYYYFPTVATDRFIEFQYSFSPAAAVVEEGETNVTGYEVKQEGEQWRLYAKYGEKIEDTGLSFYEDLNVHAVKDFDGDGNVDAVVSEIMSGGNDDSIYHPFIVFYDNESGTFKKTKQMDYYGADPIVEDWNNMCTVCQSEGLRKVRYALKDGELTIVEDWMKSVGNVLHTIKMSELFGDDENADKVIEIDFDNDGENEKLTFHHGVSHAEYYGAKMNLMGVEWSDGRTLEMCINADIFKILEETTNGMPDIIADELLWRWNGSEYDYYGWDGNNLVKH